MESGKADGRREKRMKGELVHVEVEMRVKVAINQWRMKREDGERSGFKVISRADKESTDLFISILIMNNERDGFTIFGRIYICSKNENLGVKI